MFDNKLMCDVCKIEDIDSAFVNGPNKNRKFRVKFYKVFKGEVAVAALCNLHSIELFLSGEPVFFKRHKRFALVLAKGLEDKEEDDGFGFAS